VDTSVYIDDELDTNISRYIVQGYKKEGLKKIYDEIEFNNEKGYDSLINDERIKEANIILIDSKLFENDKVSSGKFSCEEFKMILKKVFPYIEVIVCKRQVLFHNFRHLIFHKKWHLIFHTCLIYDIFPGSMLPGLLISLFYFPFPDASRIIHLQTAWQPDSPFHSRFHMHIALG